MPSKKKKYNARFPPARIKKIMQTDEEIGKVAAAVPVIIFTFFYIIMMCYVSEASLISLARALELFVESLVTKTSLITKSRNAKTLTASHLKQCVLADSSFDFLKSIVASVPDVQGEEEQAIPCSLDGALSAGESREAQSSRPKRQKDRATSEDSAGPSHSTADESETWSAEEDGEEDSGGSSTESAPGYPVSSLPPAAIPPVPCNVAFATSSSHHYMSHQSQCIPSNNTSSADDDYDS